MSLGRRQTRQTHGWVQVDGMRFDDARVGVHPHEHQRCQSVEASVALWVPTARAAQQDSLGATVDWSAVPALLQQILRQGHFNLIETLAERWAAGLLQALAVRRLRLRVCKLGCLSNGRASVRIERWAKKRPAVS